MKMLFVVYCLDKPDSLELRLANREAHITWIKGFNHTKLVGPLFADDGETMIGSMLLIEAESLDAAKAWASSDPYAQAGLFEEVNIRPWKHVLGSASL